MAISNHRLVAFANDHVSFRWRDYAHGGKRKIITVPADEFLRRFLLHVLPKSLVRIRHFGLFANQSKRDNATGLLFQCDLHMQTMLIIERVTRTQPYFRSDQGLATA